MSISTSTMQSKDAQIIPIRGGFEEAALVKLGVFTVLMVVGPIATYFASLKYVWGGEWGMSWKDPHVHPADMVWHALQKGT
ncbi:hypothetical protein EMMF5_004783 [Cystobasidiomycetes sp. EMM_F5]